MSTLYIKGAQLNPTVGDLTGNTKKVLRVLRELSDENDLVVFPELTLTGYPPLDLVLRPGFVQEQNRCLGRVLDFTRDTPHLEDVHVVLGAVTTTNKGNGLHNSLLVICNGKIKLTYHKQLLPTYNIFDERRIFTPGGKKQKPYLKIKDKMVLFLICEDLWSAEGNALYGERDLVSENKPFLKLDLIVSINASPAEMGKVEKRYQVMSKVCRKHSCSLLYVNQVGGNDDQIYDGCSFAVASDGNEQRLLKESFSEGVFSCELHYVSGGYSQIFSGDPWWHPSGYYQYLLDMLIVGIRDYVNKCGFKGVTVSLSGGIDSALVTTLAVLALGKDRVECTTMPSKYSSEGSVNDSRDLCENLGIPLFTLQIAEVVDSHLKAYEESYGAPMSPLAQENLQAAIRGNAIMRRSNSSGNLVLIGSNKSEGSVGYFTIFGDSNGGLAPIGDLYKTEVYALARYINEKGIPVENIVADDSYVCIPQNILDKEPSAELAPGQFDSNSLPPYPVLDAILKLFIEGDLMSETERSEQRGLLEKYEVTEGEVARVLSLVDKSEFKRRMLAPILRVHSRAFGPGRVLPLAKGKETHADMWSFI